MPGASTTTLPPGRWRPDRSRSRLGYALGPLRGRFEDYELELVVSDAGEAGLSASVRGAHFLATAIRRDGDLLEIDGELTIDGRTLAVTGSGTVASAAGRLQVAVSSVVDHRQFGLAWDPPATAGTEVAVHVDLTLTEDSP